MKGGLFLMLLAGVLVAGCAGNSPQPERSPGTPPAVPRPPASDAPEPSAGPVAEAQHCVALSMYWEARGEGRLGMAAVGAVVLNRVESNAFPNDPCSVVYEGGETPPCQFSWWCDGKSDRPRDRKQWAIALVIAEDLLAGRLEDPTNGALFFHSSAIKRPWQRVQTARIGEHLFYR